MLEQLLSNIICILLRIIWIFQDLFDIKFLPSMELQSWCKTHTKRPEFFKLIPRSLFDLVEKCLTVNPRLRLSADEALRHEFFASCHESLRKQRMLRQGLSLDSANVQSDHLLHGQSQGSSDLWKEWGWSAFLKAQYFNWNAQPVSIYAGCHNHCYDILSFLTHLFFA